MAVYSADIIIAVVSPQCNQELTFTTKSSCPGKAGLFRAPDTSDCKNPPDRRILGGGIEFD
ncbi:MAG: hypothetical protein LUD84_06710, partial [Clostridiales bacterium]|nr:hypothetical protein [Clostridiales bacterium]